MSKLITKFLKYLFLVVFVFLLFTNSSFAAIKSVSDSQDDQFGLWSTAHLVNFNTESAPNIAEIVGNIVGVALSFLGVIFMILVIYGGFTWMLAKGNEADIDEAMAILGNAATGLAVVLSAYILSNYILSTLSQVINQ